MMRELMTVGFRAPRAFKEVRVGSAEESLLSRLTDCYKDLKSEMPQKRPMKRRAFNRMQAGLSELSKMAEKP